MSAESPFVHIAVRPYYGAGQAVVAWRVTENYRTCGILVYRSLDGQEPWQLLNPDEEPVFGQEFVDTTLPLNTVFNAVMYRVAVETEDGTILPGHDVGMYAAMSLRDQVAARRYMVAELRRLQRRAGVPAFLFSERREGTWTRGLDTQTQRLTKLRVLEAAGGAAYAYEQPYQTWVQLIGGTTSRTARPEGTGDKELVETSARFPGFPRPVRGTLVVVPASDDRYVVGAEVKPFEFLGLVPVAYQVSLQLLPRHDVRYKLPVPQLDPRLTQPACSVP